MNLKLVKLQWPEHLGVRLFDRQIILSENNNQFVGRKVSAYESDANKISFMEAVERKIVDELGLLTSSGCAVHNSLEYAKEKARNELYERHLLIEFFYLGGKIEVIKDKLENNDRICLEFVKVCEQFCLNFTIYKYLWKEHVFCGLEVREIEPISFGRLFTCCISKSFNQAIIKNISELFPKLAHRLVGNSLEVDNNIFNKLSAEQSSRISSFEYDRSLNGDVLLREERHIHIPAEVNFQIYKLENFDWFQNIAPDFKGFFVAANCDSVHKFFWGMPEGKVYEYLKHNNSRRVSLPLPIA